jgi:hypothetical protein
LAVVAAAAVLLASGTGAAQDLPFKIYGGTKFRGNDLYQVHASTTRDCTVQCLAVAQCGTFTFHMPGGTCPLKSAPSQTGERAALGLAAATTSPAGDLGGAVGNFVGMPLGPLGKALHGAGSGLDAYLFKLMQKSARP